MKEVKVTKNKGVQPYSSAFAVLAQQQKALWLAAQWRKL